MVEPLFFTALYALGLMLSNAWASRLGWGARVLLAYPMGQCAWAFTSILLLGLGVPFTTPVMTGAMLVLAGAAISLQVRQCLLEPQKMIRVAATIPAFLLFAWAATRKNLAEFSFDSHYIVLVGKGLAFEGKIIGRITEQLAEWGAFQLMFHSAAELYGTTYFHASSFLVGAHIAGLLVWLTARLIGGPQANWLHALWGLVAAIAVCSVHFIGFHFFYIHTNFPSALYLLLFAGCGWCYLREENDAWLPPIFVGAAAFALQRTETLLPAVLFLSLLVSEFRRFDRTQLAWSFGFAAITGFWQVVALRHIGEGTTILSPGKVYLLMGMIAGYLGLVGLMQFTRAGQLRHWLNPLALLAMSVATLATTLSKPAHMGTSLFSTFANLFLGFWGAAWFLVVALAAVAWLLPRLEKGRFVGQGLVSYALLILLLGFMREPYSNRWPDSANRMFVHLLPLAILCFAVKFGSALFERRPPAPVASVAA